MARSRHGRGHGVGARLVLAVLLALSFALSAGAGLPAPTALAAGPCDAPVNPIVAENCLTGNPASEWDVSGAGDASIQGFATDISVNRGETVPFKIKTNASDYRLDIYRMGYYGGQGARKVATVKPSVALPQTQPDCLTDAATGLIDCGNWAVSASWAVPANAVSGIYFAKLVRTGAGGREPHRLRRPRRRRRPPTCSSRPRTRPGRPTTTTAATASTSARPAGRAYKVSYNRPFNTRAVDGGQDWVFNAEYPMVRWLERNGYDVSYTTGVDTRPARRPDPQPQGSSCRSGTTSTGRAGQRANVEAARDAGVNLAFFSGNEVFWKTRWENSIDGSGTPYRTLVTYKETHANAKIDPSPAWTGTWRDPRFSPPADGGRPENALTGTIFTVNGGTDAMHSAGRGRQDALLAQHQRRDARRRPDAPRCPTARSATSGTRTSTTASGPAGLIRLSTTTVSGADYMQDYGSNVRERHGDAPPDALPRTASGALVFGAGTVQWSWGLDGDPRPRPARRPTSRMQQATVNLFADMGVQPATLQAGLVAATASTDTTAPTSTITVAGRRRDRAGRQHRSTITGTATDAGGGGVGGVEVSVDGGATWQPATGRGQLELHLDAERGRAGDDQEPRRRRQRQPRDAGGRRDGDGRRRRQRRCPCTHLERRRRRRRWPDDTTPAPIELGVKFRADVAGSDHRRPLLQGRRQHRHARRHALDERRARCWPPPPSPARRRPAGSRSASPAPVAITANTTYVASYYAPDGRYARDSGYFAAGERRQRAAARRCATAPTAATASTATAPAAASRPRPTSRSNYWVDVVFVTSAGPDTTPPTVTGRTAGQRGDRRRPSATTVTATFSEAMDPATITTDHVRAARRRQRAGRRPPSPTTPPPAPPRSRPTAALAAGDHLHRHGQGRGDRPARQGRGRQRPGGQRDLVVHDGGGRHDAADGDGDDAGQRRDRRRARARRSRPPSARR